MLDAVTSCFWRRGLEATSVRDLTHETGLNAPSLYNAFGDKRHLFIRALEHYAETAMRKRLKDLEDDPSPRAAITAFFRGTIDRSVDDPERRGCLVINTALEVAPHDEEIRSSVAGYLAAIEAFLGGRVSAAQAVGEVSADLDACEMGQMLLGLLVAIRVLARAGAGRENLERMMRPAMALLDACPKGAEKYR